MAHDHTNETETRAEPDDAIAMLQADHCTIRRLFRQYAETNDHDLKRRIAEKVYTALERHTYLEETMFYPAFAVETDEAGERLIGDAFRAHHLGTVLMEDLWKRAPDDTTFERRWHALRDRVEQHMDEEERELFPQAARLLATEMEELTEAMQEIQALSLAS